MSRFGKSICRKCYGFLEIPIEFQIQHRDLISIIVIKSDNPVMLKGHTQREAGSSAAVFQRGLRLAGAKPRWKSFGGKLGKVIP